ARHELAENVGAGRGANARSAEQILDAKRHALERTALAFGEPRIGRACHLVRLLRRFQHERIERTRLLDRGEMRIGEFGRGKLLLAQSGARLRQCERGEVGHSAVGSSQENGFFSAGFGAADLDKASAGASGVGASHSRFTGKGCTGKAPNSSSTAAVSSVFTSP